MNGRLLVIGISVMILFVALMVVSNTDAQETATDPLRHMVEPGDTWTALALRYGVDEGALRAANPHPNRQQQPTIGQVISIPEPAQSETFGMIANRDDGGLLQLAAATGASPWTLTIVNGLDTPYRPLLYRSVFLPDEASLPRQLPVGFRDLEVSRAPALPGQALAIRGVARAEVPFSARFASIEMLVSQNGSGLVALTGTGAFFEPGQYLLEVAVAGEPLWAQPWLVAPGEWTYEEITYTGPAATIDAESIRQERERLAAIWSENSGPPYWSSGFAEPLQDYLAISSLYGARRSYSGGPYDRYHEGLDFSAYGGTPVYAPSGGIVVLAEQLVARGGAVIIDHGLGVFSGYYHLSEVLALPGQAIAAGDLVGRVGSTGLSTGNHLHWDLLIAGTWVDPAAWRDSDLACWLLQGLGTSCPAS